jgi:hypothetical protein
LNDLFFFLPVTEEQRAETAQPSVVRSHHVLVSRPAIRVAVSDIALSSIDEQDDASVDSIRRWWGSSSQSRVRRTTIACFAPHRGL